MRVLQLRWQLSGLPHGALGLLCCLAAVFLLLIPSRLHAEIDLPARPENHLSDQGGIFPEEAARRIVASLAACVRDQDVHIYVLTMPPKSIMPSRNRVAFDETWKAARQKWLGGKIGAVIVFDNEAGWSAIGASEEAKNILPPETLSAVLRNPELQSKKKHLSAEQLEGTVALLIREFTDLRVNASDSKRRHTTRLVVGVSAAAAAIAGAGIFIVKRRRAAHASRHRHRSPVLI